LHQIAYREWFDARHADGGAAPVVVCVHGLTRRASDFDGIAPVLAAAGCRVICPDRSVGVIQIVSRSRCCTRFPSMWPIASR
jgi:pimeloyl-ACP methyl ester carboxylesterase